MFQLRTTGDFDRIAQRLKGSLQAWDDIWFNFDQYLVEHPDWGQLIPGTRMRALPLDTRPLLTVFYDVDYSAKLITLQDVVEGI